jgi:hypothetical protein
MIDVLYRSRDQFAFHDVPRRGKWGTPTARAFPTALGNAFARGELREVGEGSGLSWNETGPRRPAGACLADVDTDTRNLPTDDGGINPIMRIGPWEGGERRCILSR